MKNCAIIGWEEGIAGQVSDWINFNILFYIYPKDDFPKINLNKIKSKPLKNFDFPKNGKYKGKSIVFKKNWPEYLKKKKVKNILILVSDKSLRTKLIDTAKKNKIKVLNAVHPSSIILKSSKLGVGIVIEPFVFIGYKVQINDGVIIQQNSSVEHGSLIEKGVTINPNVTITGNCHIEKNCTLHTGAIISNNINIKKNSIIGASSLVLENVKQNSFYWGIPAKFKKKNI